jgi:hypothetical protein
MKASVSKMYGTPEVFKLMMSQNPSQNIIENMVSFKKIFIHD